MKYFCNIIPTDGSEHHDAFCISISENVLVLPHFCHMAYLIFELWHNPRLVTTLGFKILVLNIIFTQLVDYILELSEQVFLT